MQRLVADALRGVVAGAVATAAMDLLWFRRYRADGGEQRLLSWELTTSADDFGEDAPAPARVGQRIAALVGIELPPSTVSATNDVVHWATGIGWGKLAGISAGLLPLPALGVGVGTGVTAWGTSYAVLGHLGIYEPITHYDSSTLWKDLSAHLVFGATMGAALTVLGVRRRP
jgi:hypothetical protein